MNNLPQIAQPDDDAPDTPHYAANGRPAILAWGEEDAGRGAPAVLLDIGLRGATALVEGDVRVDTPVRLHVYGQHPSDWIEGTVIEVARLGLFARRRRVRVRFDRSCPYDVLKTALGRQAVRGEELPRGPVARDWR